MWKDKLQIHSDELFRFDRSYEKGNLGQEEVSLYSIVDSNGVILGSVQYTHHTSIKAPFKNSYHVIQYDTSGAIIFEERWS
jgi:hypothetical protein